MSRHFARISVIVLASIGLLIGGYWQFVVQIGNPRVIRELIEEPEGPRAQRVMLLTLPSGRRIPVNYIREGDRVYAAADGGWWEELIGPSHPVTLLVRGEILTGMARAILGDPETTDDIFSRLRPSAIEGFGTLIDIRLERAALDPPTAP